MRSLAVVNSVQQRIGLAPCRADGSDEIIVCHHQPPDIGRLFIATDVGNVYAWVENSKNGLFEVTVFR